MKVTTTVKIDDNKRELAKKNGIKISTLLDQALDTVLGIGEKTPLKLESEKIVISQKIEKLENDRSKKWQKYGRQLAEIQNHYDEIKIQRDKEVSNIDNEINDLKLKLKVVNEELETVGSSAQSQDIDYKLLFAKYFNKSSVVDNELLIEINGFAEKYNLSYKEVENKLNADFNNKLNDDF